MLVRAVEPLNSGEACTGGLRGVAVPFGRGEAAQARNKDEGSGEANAEANAGETEAEAGETEADEAGADEADAAGEAEANAEAAGDGQDPPVHGLAFMEDGRLVVLLDDGRANIVNPATGAALKLDPQPGDAASSWVFLTGAGILVAG